MHQKSRVTQLRKHAIGVLWSQFFPPLIAIVTSAVLIWTLPSKDADIVFVMLSTAAVMSAVSDFGLRNSLFTEVANFTGTGFAGFLKSVYVLRAKLGALSCFLGAIYALYFLDAPPLLAILTGLICANTYVADVNIKCLAGQLRSHWEIPFSTLEKLLVIAYLLAASGWGGPTATGTATAIVMASCIRLIGTSSSVALLNRRSDSTEAQTTTWRYTAEHAWAGTSLLFTMFSLRMPLLLLPALGLVHLGSELGIFLMISQAFVFIPTGLAKWYFPQQVRAIPAGTRLPYSALYIVSLRAVAASTLLALVFAVGGPLALPALDLAHEMPTGAYLLLVASAPATCLRHAVRLYCAAAGQSRALFPSVACGMMVQAILIAAMYQHEFVGLAAACCIGELITALAGYAIVTRATRTPSLVGPINAQ